ncbi:hypothetical protein ACLMJK_007642 [Lecanora helva]
MAINNGSESERFFLHSDSSETLNEGSDQAVRDSLTTVTWTFWPPPGPAVTPAVVSAPAPTVIPAPTSVPDFPAVHASIVYGPQDTNLNIRFPDLQSLSSAETVTQAFEGPKFGGSLFLGHLTSYPAVVRLSSFVQGSLPLGPLVFRNVRLMASTTRKTLLLPLHSDQSNAEAATQATDKRKAYSLRHFLQSIDAAAAQTLRGIDHVIIVLTEAGAKAKKWIISSTKQLKDLADYFHRTYYQETKKWAGSDDILVFCGAVTFTVAVGAFDAVVYIVEWILDGHRAREFDRMQGGDSV